jgi:hypothetical protein
MVSTAVDGAALEGSIREEAARHFGGRYGSDLEALILTGSMARSEATFVRDNGYHRVLGDAEFLLIFQDSVQWLPSPAKLAADCAVIEARLHHLGIDCSIGANRAYPAYLQQMTPHIFGYELRTCGRVILGDPETLATIPAWQAADIPLVEGWQLLMNRLIELLKAAAEADPQTDIPPLELQYKITKLYLDMASSLLIFMGEFEAGYSARCARLREIVAFMDDFSGVSTGSGRHWPFPPYGFARRVMDATQDKLSGHAYVPRAWDDLRDALACAHRLWRWEMARLTTCSFDCVATDEQLFSLCARAEPARSRLRGWASHLRKPELWYALWKRPGSTYRAMACSPRYSVYCAASKLVFRVPELLTGPAYEADSVWDATARCLPLHPEPADGAVAWRQLARCIVWNYEKLLIGTRA